MRWIQIRTGTEDSPATARLREHGAVLLGKTTTSEFGWKGLGDSLLTGITRNPWNVAHTPGGSSGGSGAAAGFGFGPLHVATDGGGSTRLPAAHSGAFGFKQTFGRVPVYPPSQNGTLFHVTPLTRSVRDPAHAFSKRALQATTIRAIDDARRLDLDLRARGMTDPGSLRAHARRYRELKGRDPAWQTANS